MLRKSNFSIEAAVANCSGAMEADTISKNGQSLKNQISKGNVFSKAILLFFIGICFVGSLQAQIFEFKGTSISIYGLDIPAKITIDLTKNEMKVCPKSEDCLTLTDLKYEKYFGESFLVHSGDYEITIKSDKIVVQAPDLDGISLMQVFFIYDLLYFDFNIFVKAKNAQMGNATTEDLYQIGNYFKEKNLTQAVYWYRKAAEQGQKEAQYALGSCYYNGEGVTKDLEQAANWWRKAAEQGVQGGDAVAQNYLGYCYSKGEGVTQNLEQAIYWWRKAAEQGNNSAQYNLGVCYKDGIGGVEKDPSQAVYWWRKSAEQGYSSAQYNLGIYYYGGIGVEKDSSQAVYWWRKAAEQEHSNAEYNLGACYYNGGIGLEKDGDIALYWFEKAIKNGDGKLTEKNKNSAEAGIKELKEQGYSSSRAKIQ